MKSVLFVVYLFLVASCAQTPIKGKTYKLTILHTNDHHGRFWANKDGEYGLAPRATLIANLKQQIKEEGGHVLLLDAGDVNTGVPQSDLLDAEPDFRGMAAIGYDVMAVGNHEFDRPLTTIFKQQKDWAKFPFISANIYNNNKQRVFPSHITKQVSDLKVTIFGLTTEDTPKKSRPENSKDLIFVPAVEEAKALVPKLRKEADVLIALTHMGHYPDENHGTDAPGDVTLAREVNGIDVVVGGHTQLPLFKPDIQNGTIIVQAYEWGKYVGKVDLEITDGKVTLKNYELIPVNLKNKGPKILPDEKMLSLLRPFKEKGDESLHINIGTADAEFIGRRDIVRSRETNLGNLVTKAYKEKFNADLALANAGGIRDSIYPGPVKIETVLMVMPFAGEVVTAELTGDELKTYLEAVIKNGTPGSGSFPHMSGVTIRASKKTGKIVTLKVNEKEVSASKKYIIGLPEFIASGGDKYPVLTYRKYGYVDADILKEFILKRQQLHHRDFAPRGYLILE